MRRMTPRRLRAISGSLLALLIITISLYEQRPALPIAPSAQDAAAPMTETMSTATSSPLYPVAKIVDGDTIKILRDGAMVTVRLIGLDTPEIVDPRKPVQCFAKEASSEAKRMLTGKAVRIEEDASQGTLEKYGRMLAYVWLPADASTKSLAATSTSANNLLFNEYMIRAGFGHEYTYRYPYKYQTEFKAAERDAREHERGLWAPGVCE